MGVWGLAPENRHILDTFTVTEAAPKKAIVD